MAWSGALETSGERQAVPAGRGQRRAGSDATAFFVSAGTLPSARNSHTAVAFGTDMYVPPALADYGTISECTQIACGRRYIFGGNPTPHGTGLSDTHRFDTTTNTWSGAIATAGGLVPRKLEGLEDACVSLGF